MNKKNQKRGWQSMWKPKKTSVFIMLSLIFLLTGAWVLADLCGQDIFESSMTRLFSRSGYSRSTSRNFSMFSRSSSTSCSCYGKDYCGKSVTSTTCNSQVCGGDGHYYKCTSSGYVYAGGNCSQSCSTTPTTSTPNTGSSCSCYGKDYCGKSVTSTTCNSQVCGGDGHYYKCTSSGYVYAGGNCSQTCSSNSSTTGSNVKDIPFYFIAIHAEPYNGYSDAESRIASDYETLKKMVSLANSYKIKLSLMLSASWTDYINKSSTRRYEVNTWRRQGHEVGAHHHGLEHGFWDGYSNYSSSTINSKRTKVTKGNPEPYQGTLTDYANKLNSMGFRVNSGCANEEGDKNEMPDSIIYSICSGYANTGPVGTKNSSSDTFNPDKGKSDYILVGSWKGITRKWLSSFLVVNTTNASKAVKSFAATSPSSVYGITTHAISSQYDAFNLYISYLHKRDPSGRKSRVLNQIASQKLIPEQWFNVSQ